MASTDVHDVPGPVSHAPRDWPLAIVLALLGAATFAAIVWCLLPVRFEAAALVQVFRNPPQILREGPAGMEVVSDFDTYKRTQVALIKSHFVRQAALRKTAVARLPIVRGQADPIAWLTNELSVDYPGDAEILRIAM